MLIKYRLFAKTSTGRIDGEVFEDDFECSFLLKDMYAKIKNTHNIDPLLTGHIKDIKKLLWSEYNFINFNDCNNESLYYDLSLKQLNDEFNISNRIIDIYYIGGLGGMVGSLNGILFFFHTNEKDIHHKPHIHCKYNEIEYRIDLNTLKCLDKKTFKNPKLNKLAVEAVTINQSGLLKYWDDVIEKGKSSNFKMIYKID